MTIHIQYQILYMGIAVGWMGLGCAMAQCDQVERTATVIPFEKSDTDPTVPPVDMERVYEEVKTPYKYGISPSEPWDKTFAHKPWLLKHAGTVYHFHCAVGSEGRAIALATSKDLREHQP